MKPRSSLALGAGLIAFLLTAEAAGQSNSLFRRGRDNGQHPPATTQPAGGDAQVLLGTGGTPVRRPSNPEAPPSPNPVLFQYSLIAVETPPPRKLKVNDLITVIVREDKRATSDSKLESDKKWDIETTLNNWIRLDGDEHLVPQHFTRGTPNIGFALDNQYDGKGKTERKDSLITRITAKVIDVKPNGTLVLSASKTIKNDEDVQIMTLTGICRSDDVTPDNTVLSTQLADAHIDTQQTGPVRDASRRGWLMRAFDFLRPF